MNNKIDFTITCPANPLRKETFRVYYIRHEGRWVPMPVDICGNGNGSQICSQCVSDVIKKALTQIPPFAE